MVKIINDSRIARWLMLLQRGSAEDIDADDIEELIDAHRSMKAALAERDAEIERLTKAMGRLDKKTDVFVLCNKTDGTIKVWSGTGAIQVFDCWSAAMSVLTHDDRFIPKPFALVPVEDKP